MSSNAQAETTGEKLNSNPFMNAITVGSLSQQDDQETQVTYSQQMENLRQLLANVTGDLKGLDAANTTGMNWWEKGLAFVGILAVGLGVAAIVGAVAPELFAAVGVAGEALMDLFAGGTEVAGEAIGEAAGAVGDAVGEGLGESIDMVGGFADDMVEEGATELTDMTGAAKEPSGASDILEEIDAQNESTENLSVGDDSATENTKFADKKADYITRNGGDVNNTKTLRLKKAAKYLAGGAVPAISAAIALTAGINSGDRSVKTSEFNQSYTVDNNKASQINNANSSVQAMLSNLQQMVSGIQNQMISQTIQTERSIMVATAA